MLDTNFPKIAVACPERKSEILQGGVRMVIYPTRGEGFRVRMFDLTSKKSGLKKIKIPPKFYINYSDSFHGRFIALRKKFQCRNELKPCIKPLK
jgi:hypothetical protein